MARFQYGRHDWCCRMVPSATRRATGPTDHEKVGLRVAFVSC